MKQTNNAIKFLMAQYRAIFKNANIAMVAAMVASALAAGQAQAAAGLTGELKADAKSAVDIVVASGTHDLDATSNKFAKTLTINKGASATIKNGGVTSLGDVNVNGGTLTVSGTTSGLFLGAIKDNGSDTGKQHYEHDLTATNGSNITLDQANIGVANFNISGSNITLKKGGTGGTNLTAYGEGAYQKDGNPANLSYQAVGKLTDVKATLEGGSNITAIGHLDVKGTSQDKSVFNLKGIASGSTTSHSDGLAYLGGSKKLTIDNTAINVSGGEAQSKGTALASEDLKITNSKIVVAGANDVLTIGGLVDCNSVGGTSGLTADDYTADTATIANSTINVSGTLNLGHEAGDLQTKTTFTLTGNTITNAGTINAYGDVTVEAVDGLFGENGTLNLKGSTLTVTGNKAIDLSAANAKMTADAGSELVAENASVTVAEGFRTIAPSITAASVTASKTDGSFTIKSGESVTVGKSFTVTPKEGAAKLNLVGKLELSGNGGAVNADVDVKTDNTVSGTLSVTNGTWTLPSLKITSGTTSVTNGAVLNINGKLDIENSTNGSLSVNAATVNLTDKKSDLSLKQASAVKLTNTAKLNVKAEDVFKNNNGTIALVDGGTFVQNAVSGDSTSVLNLTNGGTLSKKQLSDLVTAVGFKGIVSGVSLNAADRPADGTALSDDMAGTDAYKDVQVKVNADINKQYSVDSVVLDGVDAMTVANGGSMILNGPKNEMFVSKAGQVANVKLSENGAALVLAGSGKIGDITANAAGNGKVTIGNQADGGNVTVGAIGGNQALGSLTVNDNVNVTATGDINAQNFVFNGNKLSAKGKAITVGGTSSNTEIYGDVEAKSLTYAGTGTHIIAGDAEVKLETLDFGSGTVQVGDDAAEANGSATVVVKNLSGTGTLFVDPKYRDHAALVIAESLDASATPSSNDAGTLQGSAIVGNNAALGIGFASEAELKAVLGQFLDADGSFTENPDADKLELANALVLNKQITIASTKGITVKKGATKNDTPANNTVTLESGTGLIVTDNVYKVLDDGSKSGEAINFGASGTVSSTGGKVILSGSFDGKDDNLQIFSNVQTVSGTLTVQSANGLLKGEINNTNKGKVNLDVVEEALKGAFTGVSAPVAELLKNTLRGEYKGAKGLGADFVYTVAGTSLTGAEVDAAAHAATYAGAQQAAVAAVTTMADAMFGRVGAVGVEAASISATGSQANGGVWLTPMYKSVDSDGFNAEGVSYGSDVDLAGVAFGTDTVNGNMRFGAVFNIGSGDAEGKGQGNGLKDEFDYYGFGIYSAMGFGNFALVGDASMTVISHDVEGFGLKGNADTTAVTMGVTGQYTVSTPMVDVTPHLGARFIRLNTDSYDLTSAEGVLATTDFDVQNVFSVPVGVTLSKAFVAGGWSLAPSADLTIAFNTGDTDAKSNTQFNSSKSMSVATNTEVLDEVTYGLTLGLGAQYGAFGTSFGINYTGSSNTDSLGVNAQARYMF